MPNAMQMCNATRRRAYVLASYPILNTRRWRLMVLVGNAVQVTITSRGLQVVVDGLLNLQRTFWWDQQQAARRGSDYQVSD